MESEEASLVKTKYADIFAALDAYENSCFNTWGESISFESDINLQKHLYVRDKDLLRVNFDPKVVALLREVKYFGALTVKVPAAADEIYCKAETFRTYIFALANIAVSLF
jgi:dynein heavy chain